MQTTPSREISRDRPAARRRVPAWLTRMGFAGFLFFLVKGLLWLLIPALLVGRRWLVD